MNEMTKKTGNQSSSTSTKRAIEDALKRNRELQEFIRGKIFALAEKKARNRKRSQVLMGCLYSSLLHELVALLWF